MCLVNWSPYWNLWVSIQPSWSWWMDKLCTCACALILPTCKELWCGNQTVNYLKNFNTANFGRIWNPVSRAEVLCWTHPLSPPCCPSWLCHFLYNVPALKAVHCSCSSCWQKLFESHSFTFQEKKLCGLFFPVCLYSLNSYCLETSPNCVTDMMPPTFWVSPFVNLAFYYVVMIAHQQTVLFKMCTFSWFMVNVAWFKAFYWLIYWSLYWPSLSCISGELLTSKRCLFPYRLKPLTL